MFKRKSKSLVLYNSATLNYNMVSSLLQDVWVALEQKAVPISEIKVVYSVVSELLENVMHYSNFNTNEKHVLFDFQEKTAKDFFIKVSNPVDSDKALMLKEKIIYVNSLSKVGLKKLYQYEIVRNKDSNHQGAGLGLIIVARKSVEPIDIQLQKITDSVTIVTLNVKICLNKNDKH